MDAILLLDLQGIFDCSLAHFLKEISCFFEISARRTRQVESNFPDAMIGPYEKVGLVKARANWRWQCWKKKTAEVETSAVFVFVASSRFSTRSRVL